MYSQAIQPQGYYKIILNYNIFEVTTALLNRYVETVHTFYCEKQYNSRKKDFSWI